jgi:hypothetical protein
MPRIKLEKSLYRVIRSIKISRDESINKWIVSAYDKDNNLVKQWERTYYPDMAIKAIKEKTGAAELNA